MFTLPSYGVYGDSNEKMYFGILVTMKNGVPKVRVILASASPARRQTLESAGLCPEVRVSAVDEDALLARCEAQGLGPESKVLVLAQAKARQVAAAFGQDGNAGVAGTAGAGGTPDADLAGENPLSTLVIGCDSMLEFHGQVLGKPHDPQVALARVWALSGDAGVLHTGHWMIRLDVQGRMIGEEGNTESTRVFFAEFSHAEAQAYVDSGEPLEVAGSFTIDGLGGAFIRRIEGDPHNVVGISLPLLRRLAQRLEVFWPDLWAGV